MNTQETGVVILLCIDGGKYEYCEIISQQPIKTVVKVLRTGEIKTIYLLYTN